MQKYELVLLLDHAMKKDERESMLVDFEKNLGSSVLQKDDIGMQSLVYALGRDKNKDSAYFVCYYLELDLDGINAIKKDLLYNKSVLRSVFFRMKESQKFVAFDEMQKELKDIIEGRGTQRFGQKVSFYSHSENEKYISRKAIPMLEKYLTRFGDIKPRRYTNNAVNKQKKLRKAVIRARELGLLNYTK